MSETVLVTGGSGFIGSWCLLYALQQGYRARTTVRSLKRADAVRQALINGGATKEQADSVEFVAADLTSDQGWPEACKGCTYVLHVASPFPAGAPKSEDDLIIPAREGTLRALRAASAAGVKRVVVTSSIAAVAYGHEVHGKTFTEKDWTNVSAPGVPAYQKSKTLAEEAAWDFIKNDTSGMELATVLPCGVSGPVLSKSAGTSVDIVVKMLRGDFPAMPKLSADWIDVRDVADLHIRAMRDPKAAGERFLAVGDHVSLRQFAGYLKEGLGPDAKKATTREMPNFVVKFMANFISDLALITGELDNPKKCSSDKAKSILGWQVRSTSEAVVSCGRSCIQYGLV